MKHLYIAILILAFLSSCTDKDTTLPEDAEQTIVNNITVARNTRTDDPADESNGILTNNDFSEGSILYISQMGTTEPPNFPANTTSDNSEKNLYVYKWYENDEADWDYEYNFKPIGSSNPLNWSTIKSLGNVGNAFSLYAMYFPEEQKIRYDVELDQSEWKNFHKSDIMGAYHATSSLFSRLRFRLFHLMVYLRVKLYVPVIKTEDNGYSGFGENALKTAKVLNAIPNFDIEWRTNRTSDSDAPLTYSKGDRKDIIMYQHENLRQITLDNVADFYPQGNITEDEVIEYNFSVLFPAQEFSKNNNILCFQLQTQGQEKDDKVVNYYFAASQRIGSDDSGFNLTQGTLQWLYLYLPRTGNKTILISAKKLPWIDASTDMTVTEEKTTTEEN